MKKPFHRQAGFTLVEMMIVLMIISILLLVALPSMTKNNEVAGDKGCEATVKLLQTQVHAYEIDHDRLPTNLDALKREGYVEHTECPNGKKLTLRNGVVAISE
ncbi:competence type IV pilus major pilin ComGC [Halalkalibacterium halodurans]|jgi:competence protein ComGC|uniref:ComG operon protein 3 n=1 Tax=Halalkalibacterium halodurans TaxID=86665 RepID=A0A0M0KHX2_ALKHA|nr:competence type IV pilus major pilin ComGC [Halalkalibacterium halodurans]MDY7223380.1 competence type IV pilus major pilin ComGC [Halalkalibacterium halodurans]MDY7242601.1 competence type IV pilus major pilin ComGC [Halalkalibacterium halodurans]MED3647291.1 competence type IV pilus major pilin ComGC [Halalkalibacterium halodurans]MED4162497.1 competence type IV pilus major pilin ComGC [Halalkalibacterium halodurans]TPE65859.1 prepilin-type N-terminal cleavage/methylation domain-containin